MDGNFLWTISVTDLAGNTTTQSYEAEIDKTPPVLLFSSFETLGVGLTSEFLKWRFEAEAGLRVTVFDGEKTIKVSASSTGDGVRINHYTDDPNLNGKRFNVILTATDLAGNIKEKIFPVTWIYLDFGGIPIPKT